MALIEQSLREYLTGYAGLTALVGTKIYSSIIPQGTELPAVTYNIIGGGPTYSLAGDSCYEMEHFRFSIWVDKNDALTGLNISKQLKNALSGYRGNMGSTYLTKVEKIFITNIHGKFEGDSEGHGRFIDCQIDYIST